MSESWISTKDKLPERYVSVIVASKRFEEAVFGYLVPNLWWVIASSEYTGIRVSLDDVTHWQPLPKLPKEE